MSRGGAVHAVAHLEAGASGGRTVLARLRSAPPLVLRRSGPGHVHLVAVGAGPLGGDDLALRIQVGDGAHLRVTQVAASVALPDTARRPSRLRYDVEVGERAHLEWEGQPTVAAAGATHRTELRVVAAASASLAWREEVVCGRHDEPSGVVHSAVTVTRAGTLVLRSETTVGDELWASPAVGGGARVYGSLLLLGAPASLPPVSTDTLAVLRPRDGLAVVTALGAHHPEVRAHLAFAAGSAGTAASQLGRFGPAA